MTMSAPLTGEQRDALAELDNDSEPIGWSWDGEAWDPLSTSKWAKQPGVTGDA
jgi:hypothetical protein